MNQPSPQKLPQPPYLDYDDEIELLESFFGGPGQAKWRIPACCNAAGGFIIAPEYCWQILPLVRYQQSAHVLCLVKNHQYIAPR